jgi:predicted transposase YdaD
LDFNKKAIISIIYKYFELKNKSFYYDILEKSRTKQQKLAEEIEKLRDEGTQESNARANTLLLLLESERNWISTTSAYYTKIDQK